MYIYIYIYIYIIFIYLYIAQSFETFSYYNLSKFVILAAPLPSRTIKAM